MSSAIVVTSGKGGTGKTSVTAGVASCLAALGCKVLCVDMDVGLRNLDVCLGMTDRALMDFTDVLEGRCTLQRAAAAHPDIPNLCLLTAPVTVPSGFISPWQMKALMTYAKEEFDYVLIDSPAGIGEAFQLAAAGADRGIIVATADTAALRDAQRVVARLSKDLPQLHLVVNRVQPKLMKQLEFTVDDAMDAAGLPLLGVVPEDPQVILTSSCGRPLILASRKRAALAFLNIARRIRGERVPLMRIRR